jgi:hypothetical protein
MESLEASGFEGIIKEGSDLYVDYSTPPPCFVHHTEAGGWCERPAAMRAYEMDFCEVHGAEVKAGIMAEIYHDAGNVLEDAYGPEDSSTNAAAWVHLNVSVREMAHRCIEAEEAQVEALRRAYPLIPERVDTETREHDYGVPNHANDDPVDMYFDSRIHVLRLMRLSWSVGQYWLFEQLEKER